MSETLHIGRLDARYRLSAPIPGAQRRLDALLEGALHSEVPQQLMAVAATPHEDTCIRRLDVRAHVRWGSGEVAIARSWARAVAEAIERALASGSPDVVRYRSPAERVRDMGECVLRGDLSRAWAWRQLGGWEPAEGAAPDRVLDAWIEHWAARAELVVPLLAEWAPRGVFAALTERLLPWHWVAVARAARAVARGEMVPGRPGVRSRGPGVLLPGRREPHRSDATAPLVGLSERSAIARAAAAHGERLRDPGTRRALAQLAWLEEDPIAARNAGEADLDARAERIFRRGGDAAREEPEPAVGPESPSREALPERTGEVPAVIARFGGLLFLLGVVEELGIPELLCEDARPLRAGLHALALALLPLAEDAPEALAFCGLGPRAAPPSRGEAPPDREQRARVEALAARVRAALEERLAGRLPDAQDVLRFVCERRAEIVADPGWVELRFALSEVSTEIRAAGLDLDPGYVPWLGVCVRFSYV